MLSENSPKLNFNTDLPESVSSLLLDWKLQIEKSEEQHRKNAEYYRIANLAVGFPAVILSALYTTGSLATIKDCATSTFLYICIPQIIFGCIVTICTSIMTFGNFSNNSALNKSSSDRFQDLEKTIETYLHTKTDVDPAIILSIIQNRYNDILNSSPVLPTEKKTLNFFVKKNTSYTVRNDQSLDAEMMEKMKSYSLEHNPEFKYQHDRFNDNNV